MAIQLKNSSNTIVYEFPSGCNIISEPWSKRQDSEPRAYQNGVTRTGDEKVNERIISLHGIFGVSGVNATYGATVVLNLREMQKQCNTEDLRLYPGSQYTDQYYNVELFNFEHNFVGKIGIVEIFIDFQVVKPFRNYKDETTDTEAGITASPHAYTVSNGGDEAVYPVWTFTGGASTVITSTKIANAEDGAKYFTYTGSIGNADAVVIDCAEGTVKRNGTSNINNFTGTFLKLASGTNNLTITLVGTVGTCSCVAVFRKKYL